VDLLDRALERLLDEIVGTRAVALQRAGEAAQVGDVTDQQILERGRHGLIPDCCALQRGRCVAAAGLVPLAEPAPT